MKSQTQILICKAANLLINVAGILCTIALVASCTGLSKISDEQYLITEYKLQIDHKKELAHTRRVRNKLADEITKKPNTKLLWMRPWLALHNTISEPKKDKGLKHWLKYRLGQPPVLLDEQYCENLNLTFENRLYHLGHFNAKSTFAINKKNKTATIEYHIEPGKVYMIDTLIFPQGKDTIENAIHSLKESSLIKIGQSYELNKLKRERQRLDDKLKNMGFYYFNPDFISFLADTTDGDHKVKLKLQIKKDTPEESRQFYSIGKIEVAEDFRLENYQPDTTEVDSYKVISATNYMKPKYFLNSVLYDSSSIYSKKTHNNTIRQLMSMRTYKFVNAVYKPSVSKPDALDVSYLMTPASKMSVSAELNAISKSNSFAGPGIKLTYNSKNFFRGAELFSINVNGRFEKQITNTEQGGDTAYEVSVDANLDLPRIIPFKIRKKDHPYLPNSNIVLGAGLFARVSLYRFNTFTTGLGYTWRRNEFLSHLLKPIDISVTNLIESTDEFEKFLESNPSIRQSFEEQFIVGFSYNFVINKLDPSYPRRYYINLGADPSGNLVSALSHLFGTRDDDSEEPVKIFGQPVSQYVRVRSDLRYYFKTGKESIIASRLNIGVGVPYGNSSVMPYVKQFYAGGTNSLRAFRARSVGPGSYKPPEDQENVLVDQTGEIRLESNLEYRFPIMGYLKGAAFTDIGNIWLVNEDTLRQGGKFEFDTFYEQLAIGVGFGLRVDVNLMVLRLDWAFPIRIPSRDEENRWVIRDIDLLSREWRKKNLLWNISIGYPF